MFAIRRRALGIKCVMADMEGDQRSFVCVECGLISEEIYREFKGGSFTLCICVSIIILQYKLQSIFVSFRVYHEDLVVVILSVNCI